MVTEGYVCSACGGSRFIEDAEGNIACAYCGTTYELASEKYECRVCGTVNPAEAKRCMQCGAQLGRQCPVCTHFNPPGATVCEECQTPLGAFTSIAMRQPQAGETDRRVERLVMSKNSDAAYMQNQRARLDAEEQARRARLAAQHAENRQQQKKIILIVSIGMAGFIVLVIVLAVLLGG